MLDNKVTFGLLVVFGLMLVYPNAVTSANGQTPWIHKSDVFNGGKYSDPQNGIEVTFPDGWSGHKIILGNATVIGVSKNSTGFLIPTISLEVVDKSFIQDMGNLFTKLAKNPVIAQKAKSMNLNCDVTNSTISVNGMGGFKMTFQCSDFPLKSEDVMFATDQNIIALIYQANSTEFEKYGTDFNNTLNTLTISNAVKQFNPTIFLSTADDLNTTIPTLHHTYQYNISPLQQIANGVLPDKVVCSEGFVLIMKASTNSPVCVKPSTAQKLAERGWSLSKDQMIWFEFVPTQSNVPWDKFSEKPSSVTGSSPEILTSLRMKFYFTSQNITILDAKVSGTTFYFLVSESETDKMIKLGYKELTMSLPSNAHNVDS